MKNSILPTRKQDIGACPFCGADGYQHKGRGYCADTIDCAGVWKLNPNTAKKRHFVNRRQATHV